MMKGRGYNRRFLRGRDDKPEPKVYAIVESNEINRNHLQFFGAHMNDTERTQSQTQLEILLNTFTDAREYGSILNVDACDWDKLEQFVEDLDTDGQISFESVGSEETQASLRKLVKVAKNLGQKYDAVVTNPPYMGASGMGAKLSKYVKDNFTDSKSDLFAVFIEKCGQMAKRNGYQAMITQHAWMFLSSFEKLRKKLQQNNIVNMAHLGPRAFEEIGGEVVQTTSFVIRKSNNKGYKGTYCRLIEPTTQQGKEEMFLVGENRYYAEQENFAKIPGSPVAYWVSEKVLKCYMNKSIYDFANPCKGIDTGDNSKFLRMWFEISNSKCFIPSGQICTEKDFGKYKWFPYNKGGNYRKWYGNNEYVLNWENNGSSLRNFKGSNLRNKDRYFEKGITWSTVTSGKSSFRYFPYGFLFDNGGSCLFARDHLTYIQGFLNSIVSKELLNIQPTINNQPGTIGGLPLIISKREGNVVQFVEQNVRVSKYEWDSFETSWDFQRHPLVCKVPIIAEAFNRWQEQCDNRFNQLKANEEELNRIFIDIYDLQDELTPEVEDKDITVRKADLSRDIRSFISYAVGCMFGRYSLDEEGLIYAGGDWSDTFVHDPIITASDETYGREFTLAGDYVRKKNGEYAMCTFLPDDDNCLPITDEEYFSDDIVGRFVEFVKTVYGANTLEENLDFIADALGNKGDTSREVIRNYFLKDFYADHLKVYQKRPIYWLFDSGKQNGFKVLIYMHRYDADTVGRVRTDYLHRAQKYVETASSIIINMNK